MDVRFSLKYILFKYITFVVTYTFPYVGLITSGYLNLKVFENKGPRKIFGSKRIKIMEEFWMLCY
jgi:hypothetical protein